MKKYKISSICIYLDVTSCKKGFPPDMTCETGFNNSCPYYSNYYDPVREEFYYEPQEVESDIVLVDYQTGA